MRPEISTKLAANQNPLKVNLAGLNIKDSEISEIMAYIKINKPAAIKIDLDNNHITDKGAKTLSDYFREFSDVQEISIQYNKIGKSGAIELFRLKNDFSKLDILFHGNKITNVREMDDIEQLARSGTYRP
ncbi:hypothetical protein Lbir_2167 [Legionella birminghamensis]|uniref:Ran GTPase-activating protein (RanGAP) involved in mRNA processing and transport n=1 Tax=Legionella birminghamensis TaxID=28083 RepID=A0A378I953_9GAMM|nr:hypothetical protein [Legionella birminghamensis]KTC69428.1 hypothetical protein Lbir_2167 [Legionella birminghamensis]STX31669.1 Ran GTPase-activating protein (RanGAP) involved in mRNA processing and transport [Legionella birminghamensis]